MLCYPRKFTFFFGREGCANYVLMSMSRETIKR